MDRRIVKTVVLLAWVQAAPACPEDGAYAIREALKEHSERINEILGDEAVEADRKTGLESAVKDMLSPEAIERLQSFTH